MKIFIRIYISNNIFLFLFFILSLDIDKDGSGTIDFSDFLDMMTSKMSERDSREEILKAFRLFDDDETGKLVIYMWLFNSTLFNSSTIFCFH